MTCLCVVRQDLANHGIAVTPIPGDEHYYEATYNGDKDELYLDVRQRANESYKIGDEND